MVQYSDVQLDRVFHALADPLRRGAIDRLRGGEMALSRLADPMPISMPAVLKHIAVLEKAGLVVTNKRGRTRYCRLEPEALEHAQSWLEETRSFWTAQLDSLHRHLEENP